LGQSKQTFVNNDNENDALFLQVWWIVRPPLNAPKQEEKEPSLILDMDSVQGEVICCPVEDLCHVSIRQRKEGEDVVDMEVARRSGIPLHLAIKGRLRAKSALGHLTGYYRLCEKSTFSLCSELPTPLSDGRLKLHVHGPCEPLWAASKLRAKGGKRPGAYLMRQSQEDFSLIHLDYLIEGDNVESLRIERDRDGENADYVLRASARGAILARKESLADLVKEVKLPGNLKLSSCLHPSENDRSAKLLPCRSDAKNKQGGRKLRRFAAPLTQFYRHIGQRRGLVRSSRSGRGHSQAKFESIPG